MTRLPLRRKSATVQPKQPAETALRFLRFHVRRVVTQWQWLMQGAQLRATDDTGRTATISKIELAALVDADLIALPHIRSGVRLTKKARELIG